MERKALADVLIIVTSIGETDEGEPYPHTTVWRGDFEYDDAFALLEHIEKNSKVLEGSYMKNE